MKNLLSVIFLLCLSASCFGSPQALDRNGNYGDGSTINKAVIVPLIEFFQMQPDETVAEGIERRHLQRMGFPAGINHYSIINRPNTVTRTSSTWIFTGEPLRRQFDEDMDTQTKSEIQAFQAVTEFKSFVEKCRVAESKKQGRCSNRFVFAIYEDREYWSYENASAENFNLTKNAILSLLAAEPSKRELARYVLVFLPEHYGRRIRH